MSFSVLPLLAPPAAQFGDTALIYASYNGHTETVALLEEKGADLEAKDKVRRKCAVGGFEGRVERWAMTHTHTRREEFCLYM